MQIQDYKFKNVQIEVLLNINQLQPKEVGVQLSYKDSSEQIYKIINKSIIMNKQEDQWITNYKVAFEFNKFQSYHLDISVDENISIGSTQFQLGELIQNGTQVKTSNHFTIKLVATLLQKGTLLFQHWAAENLLNTDGIFNKSDPFLQFYQWDDDQWNQVYVTEYIQNNLNPTWVPFSIDLGLLNFYDQYKNFKIECWDHSKKNPPRHKYIGSIELSYHDIMLSPSKKFALINPEHKNCGHLKLLSCQIKQEQNFYSWIQNKQIQTLIFMEFSQSSMYMHVKSHNQLNIFQQFLIIIGSILIQYNKLNTASLYGFGGKINYQNQEFFLISTQQNGIQQICQDYSKCFKQIELHNNIQITPCFFEIIKQAEIFKPNFTIGIILILDQISDIDKFKQFLQHCINIPVINRTNLTYCYYISNIVRTFNRDYYNRKYKVKAIQLNQFDLQSIQNMKKQMFQIIQSEIKRYYELN